MKTYKVRITKAPMDQMAYGGQSNFGLDLGRKKIYTDMPQLLSEGSNQSLSEEEEDQNDPHVLEAEGGETIVHPDGKMFNISGDSHANGGVKMTASQAPENSFIFSKTKSMAIGGPILQQFGYSPDTKKKYTPAELSKKYPTNPYMAILNDQYADPLKQRTAQMMLQNNMTKQGQIALLQEAMKGFPNGIPDIAQSAMPQGMSQGMPQAKYGGMLEQYQVKGQVTNDGKVSMDEARNSAVAIKNKKDVPQGYQYLGKGEDGKEYWGRAVTTNVPGQPAVTHTQVIPGQTGVKRVPRITDAYRKASPAQRKLMSAAAQAKWEREHPEFKATPAQTVVVTDKPAVDPQTMNAEDYLMYQEDGIHTGGGGGTPPLFQYYDFSQYNPALAITPYKRKNYVADLDAVIPNPTFYDPNRELAANAELANTTQNYAANLGSAQSFMANASAAQSNAMKNAADINARYNNMNVGVANQFSPLQTDIMNKVMAYRANANDIRFANQEAINKESRSDWRQFLNNKYKQDVTNRNLNTQMNMLNAVNPVFNLVPGRKMEYLQMKPGVDANLFGQATSRGGVNPNRKSYLDRVNELKKLGHTWQEIQPQLEQEYPEMFTNVKANSVRNPMVDYALPYMNALGQYGATATGPASMLGYPYGN